MGRGRGGRVEVVPAGKQDHLDVIFTHEPYVRRDHDGERQTERAADKDTRHECEHNGSRETDVDMY